MISRKEKNKALQSDYQSNGKRKPNIKQGLLVLILFVIVMILGHYPFAWS